MERRALVIGAGWFGCEIASILDDMDIKFDIIDKTNGFFNGSSSKNQNRLHFGGFHYCRSYSTRNECRIGCERFTSKYPDLSEEVRSIYIVAKKSILDFNTYTSIFEHEKSPFEIISLEELENLGFKMNNEMVDGKDVLITNEHWINFKKAGEMFEEKFRNHMLKYNPKDMFLHEMKYGSNKYTHIFDATYGQLYQFNESTFEACITLVYKKKDHCVGKQNGITIVDGEFFSLYPYIPSQNLFTLTHVKFTPIFKSKNISDVNEYIENLTSNDIMDRTKLIENDVRKLHVNLLDMYDYHSFFISTKTKFDDNGCADRSTRIRDTNGILSVCGGKISGTCDIEKDVVDFVEGHVL